MKRLFCAAAVACILLTAGSLAASTVVTYPAPEGVKAADDYRVQVNGKDVFVYYNPVASIAAFDFEGQVEVAVTPALDAKWIDIRPKSRHIKPTVKDNTIRFKLTEPCNLSIELNGEILRHPLFLFANPLEKTPPKKGDEAVIYFEAGKVHKPGIIDVNDGQTVYIAGGALVEGAIFADAQKNIEIRGRGILDGTRLREIRGDRRIRFVHLQSCKDVEIEGIILSNSTTWQVAPYNCDNVTITNVKIVSDNGGDDGIDVVSSRDVTIRRCFIHTKDDCVVIKAWGDRRGYPRSGRRISGPPVKNVLVEECVLWNSAWGNALEIGFELRTDSVGDITFRNCDVIHCEDGATFSIHNGDFATVSNVRFENIRIEDSRQKLFDLAIFLSRYSHDRPTDSVQREKQYLHGAWDGVLEVKPAERASYAKGRGHIKNIYFKNIQIVDGLFPFSIFCGFDDEHSVENVTIDGLYVHGKRITNAEDGKFYIENAKGIRFVE